MSKTVMDYEGLLYNQLNFRNTKFMATAILASALEDADFEFLEDDYNLWKKLRKQRLYKNETMTELEYRQEFNYKQKYKESLLDIAEIRITTDDIPMSVIEEKDIYECNPLEKVMELTNNAKNTVQSIASVHGWRIGLRYHEPTLFEM